MFNYIIKYVFEKYNYIINYNNFLQLQSILILLTTFFITLFIGTIFIKKLKKLKIQQIIRKNIPKSHITKKETPTMGGIIILISITISILIWTNPCNLHTICILTSLFGYAIIGFIDDYIKITKKNTNGLNKKWKYFLQSAISLPIIYNIHLLQNNNENIQLILPFLKKSISIPQNNIWVYIIYYFIIVGTSNAVNLTDGLDGLTIMPTILISFNLAIVAWLSSDKNLENYTYIPYIPYSEKIMIICIIISGTGLGFLWFNAYPAKIFMGDIGSLSIGATLGTISILLNQELFFIIISGIFIIETISIIIQIIHFKIKNKKLFLMSPIHHHYELKGFQENHIVVRFWIISFILTFIGLMSL
ncbi:MAG: phospho-N-acetylmuramoyl-pentapeptide- transferase [Candidatus Westeberhardia cardiocondylae]|nr:phospho-N-acetylmuramoyl-pentapeptide- transferase [Candidatus Westeberhardia cardiocondylae]